MKKTTIVLLFGILLLLPSFVSAAPSVAEKLKGRILLQVESRGEAYYVNPATAEKYYMENGYAAYNVMRNLGVGITNTNLEKIKNNKALALKQKGKIFLQVESHGEAYYVDFSGNLHYLKDGSEAYNIMRTLGLGITTRDLEQIPSKMSALNIINNDSSQQHQIYSLGDSLSSLNTTSPGQENLLKLVSLLGNKWNGNNFALSGYTTTQMLAKLPEVLNNKDVEYLIVWGGVNDIRTDVANATIESNLQAIYTAAHNAGIKVIALTISPFKGSRYYTSGRQTYLDAINTWILNTATNIDYKIDVYPLLEDPGAADYLLAANDYGDGLHLTTAGQDNVGTAVYNEVTWTK